MNKEQLLNDETIHRKIKEEMLDKCFNSQLLESKYGCLYDPTKVEIIGGKCKQIKQKNGKYEETEVILISQLPEQLVETDRIYEYDYDCWEKIESNNIITKMEELLDNNCKIIIKSENQLDEMLREKGYTKYVGLNYNRSDLEKQFPFFKNFWYRGISYYSYSIKQINDYFGKIILEDNTPMTAYVINYLIFLYNKLMYWDEFS